MLESVDPKRLKFFLSSFTLCMLLFFVKFVSAKWMPLYLLFLSVAVFASLLFVLEIRSFGRVWFYVSILPIHVVVGAALTFSGFPNLSILFRILSLIIVLVVYYITLLILNIFSVVFEKGKVIPLYRVAITWEQILIIVVSIPLFAGIFKLPIHPFLQVFAITLSSFSLMLLFLWSLDFEVGEVDMNLSILTSFWVLTLSSAILFLPFEALFRGLFLSSILLFGLGFNHNFIKHTLSEKIIFEHVLITIAFLFIGLLFLP